MATVTDIKDGVWKIKDYIVPGKLFPDNGDTYDYKSPFTVFDSILDLLKKYDPLLVKIKSNDQNKILLDFASKLKKSIFYFELNKTNMYTINTTNNRNQVCDINICRYYDDNKQKFQYKDIQATLKKPVAAPVVFSHTHSGGGGGGGIDALAVKQIIIDELLSTGIIALAIDNKANTTNNILENKINLNTKGDIIANNLLYDTTLVTQAKINIVQTELNTTNQNVALNKTTFEGKISDLGKTITKNKEDYESQITQLTTAYKGADKIVEENANKNIDAAKVEVTYINSLLKKDIELNTDSIKEVKDHNIIIDTNIQKVKDDLQKNIYNLENSKLSNNAFYQYQMSLTVDDVEKIAIIEQNKVASYLIFNDINGKQTTANSRNALENEITLLQEKIAAPKDVSTNNAFSFNKIIVKIKNNVTDNKQTLIDINYQTLLMPLENEYDNFKQKYDNFEQSVNNIPKQDAYNQLLQQHKVDKIADTDFKTYAEYIDDATLNPKNLDGYINYINEIDIKLKKLNANLVDCETFNANVIKQTVESNTLLTAYYTMFSNNYEIKNIQTYTDNQILQYKNKLAHDKDNETILKNKDWAKKITQKKTADIKNDTLLLEIKNIFTTYDASATAKYKKLLSEYNTLKSDADAKINSFLQLDLDIAKTNIYTESETAYNNQNNKQFDLLQEIVKQINAKIIEVSKLPITLTTEQTRLKTEFNTSIAVKPLTDNNAFKAITAYIDYVHETENIQSAQQAATALATTQREAQEAAATALAQQQQAQQQAEDEAAAKLAAAQLAAQQQALDKAAAKLAAAQLAADKAAAKLAADKAAADTQLKFPGQITGIPQISQCILYALCCLDYKNTDVNNPIQNVIDKIKEGKPVQVQETIDNMIRNLSKFDSDYFSNKPYDYLIEKYEILSNSIEQSNIVLQKLSLGLGLENITAEEIEFKKQEAKKSLLALKISFNAVMTFMLQIAVKTPFDLDFFIKSYLCKVYFPAAELHYSYDKFNEYQTKNQRDYTDPEIVIIKNTRTELNPADIMHTLSDGDVQFKLKAVIYDTTPLAKNESTSQSELENTKLKTYEARGQYKTNIIHLCPPPIHKVLDFKNITVTLPAPEPKIHTAGLDNSGSESNIDNRKEQKLELTKPVEEESNVSSIVAILAQYEIDIKKEFDRFDDKETEFGTETDAIKNAGLIINKFGEKVKDKIKIITFMGSGTKYSTNPVYDKNNIVPIIFLHLKSSKGKELSTYAYSQYFIDLSGKFDYSGKTTYTVHEKSFSTQAEFKANTILSHIKDIYTKKDKDNERDVYISKILKTFWNNINLHKIDARSYYNTCYDDFNTLVKNAVNPRAIFNGFTIKDLNGDEEFTLTNNTDKEMYTLNKKWKNVNAIVAIMGAITQFPNTFMDFQPNTLSAAIDAIQSGVNSAKKGAANLASTFYKLFVPSEDNSHLLAEPFDLDATASPKTAQVPHGPAQNGRKITAPSGLGKSFPAIDRPNINLAAT